MTYGANQTNAYCIIVLYLYKPHERQSAGYHLRLADARQLLLQLMWVTSHCQDTDGNSSPMPPDCDSCLDSLSACSSFTNHHGTLDCCPATTSNSTTGQPRKWPIQDAQKCITAYLGILSPLDQGQTPGGGQRAKPQYIGVWNGAPQV